MKNFISILKKNTMLIVLVLVFIYFTIMTNGLMFTPLKIRSIVTDYAYVFVLSTGMLMCMLTGGNIDLSCGSFVCFVSAVGGILMVVQNVNPMVSIFAMLAVGIIYGCVLGFLIAYMNIPPWIATLAGYLAFRGLGTALITSNSSIGSISPIPKEFINVFAGTIAATPANQMNIPCLIVGVVASVIVASMYFLTRANKIKKGYEADPLWIVIFKAVLSVAAIGVFTYKLAMSGGIPTVLVWVVAIILLYSFITSKTTIGRYFYTIGGNAEATRLSGVDTRKIMFAAYLNMAILTVVTSYIAMAKFQSAQPKAGEYYEMDAISACVVGGVSAYGGSGSVFGMVIGAILIGVINTGMYAMNIDPNWQKVVKGIVLLAAVVFEILNNKDKTKA